jgi:phage-related baseplate assembly protein
VQNVDLIAPAADIVVALGSGTADTPATAAYCTAITLSSGGIDL